MGMRRRLAPKFVVRPSVNTWGTRSIAFLASFFVTTGAIGGLAWGFAIETVSVSGFQPIVWYQDYTATPCGSQSLRFSGGLIYRTCQISYGIDAATVTQSGWSATIASAASDWATYDSTRSRWSYQYFGPDNCSAANDLLCDVVLAHTQDFGPPNQFGVGIAGYAAYTATCPDTTNPCALLLADVYANTNPAFSWYVDALGGSMSPTQLDLQAVYEHELGHALGLDHPVANDSGGYTAVMECAISRGSIRRITGDDRNGLEYLYSGHSGWGNPVVAVHGCGDNT